MKNQLFIVLLFLATGFSATAQEVTYELVKEGEGAVAQEGQEVTFNGTMMDMEGNILFETKQMGYPWAHVVGSDDSFFDKGMRKVRSGSLLKVVVPVAEQDDRMKEMTQGKTAQLHIEALSIGMPKPDGAKWLGEILMDKGVAAAKEAYNQLQDESPDKYAFKQGAMNVLGYSMMQASKMDEAIFVMSLNQANHPGSWNAYDSLGDVYMASGNKEKAKECYQAALKLNPDFQPSKEKLGKM